MPFISYIKANKSSLILQTILCIVLVWLPIFIMESSMEYNNRLACYLFACIYSSTLILAHGKLGKLYILISTIAIECVNICELGWTTMNGSILTGDSLWVIYDTNKDEALGFLTTVPLITYWVVISHVVSTIALTIIIMHTHRQIQRIVSYINIVLIALLMVCCLTPFVRHKCPYVNFYTSYRLYIKDKNEVAEFFLNRKDVVIEAQCYHKEINKTIVIVIGESANRHHYSLYGYPRKTSPKLDSIANELAIYVDVISPARATLTCMKQILSFANYEQPDMYKKEASIIEILKGAGYKTYWIDNQGVNVGDDQVPSSYRTIASMSDYYHVIPQRTFDEDIMPFYDYCLSDSTQNKAIFLHLIGNHVPYDKYTPKQFWIFNDTIGLISPYRETLTQSNIETINMYDNTVLYNDSIVCEFINRLRKTPDACALLYLSDHGEEMCETYAFCGRSKEKLSRSQCDIPFILWRNHEYTEKIYLDIDTTRCFCSDDAIYAIMDIAGVSYALKDTIKSIFSSLYAPKPRKVEGVMYEDLPIWR